MEQNGAGGGKHGWAAGLWYRKKPLWGCRPKLAGPSPSEQVGTCPAFCTEPRLMCLWLVHMLPKMSTCAQAIIFPESRIRTVSVAAS